MANKTNDINRSDIHALKNFDDDKVKFSNKIAGLNAFACNNFKQEGFQLANAVKESQGNLNALGAKSPLEQILASQILSLHELQQTSMTMANTINDIRSKQYFTNAAIKLANSCTAQISLLARLQGAAGQRIVVEHVEIHDGGQAIVGNVTKGGGQNENF